MRTRRWMVVLAALLAVAALAAGLTACGSESGGGDGGDTSSEPVQGGTLNVAFQGEPTELDPAIAWEVESWAIERLCYQTFLNYASKTGEPGTELIPELATEVPSAENGGISEDGTVYTFKLRQGVTFAAPVSREVTAEDFKYSFERMMSEPLAPATFFYTGIVGAQDFIDGKAKEVKGFKVVDDSTVEITLQKADSSFLMAMTMPFTSVVPKEWVQKWGKKFNRNPLGTGMYVFEKWVPGQSITMKRNPDYWEEGKPYIDDMDFTFSANTSTALLKLQQGDIQILGDGIPAADFVRVSQDPDYKDRIVSDNQIAWYYVFMNVLEKPFDNAKVRQAVNYAIDTAKVQKLLKGQAKALNQIFPAGMPGNDADATFYSYDPEKAKQLLSEAGFADGFKCTFYGHNVDPFPTLAQAIQADLKAVGIDASIKLMDRATYWDFISLKDSHAGIGLSDWYQDFPDPSDWIGPMFTNPIDGSANSSFYESSEVDDLYAQAITELDETARLDLYGQMQDIIMEDAPTAPLYQPVWNGLAGENVGGFYIHPVWIQNYQDYWLTDAGSAE